MTKLQCSIFISVHINVQSRPAYTGNEDKEYKKLGLIGFEIKEEGQRKKKFWLAKLACEENIALCGRSTGNVFGMSKSHYSCQSINECPSSRLYCGI